MDPVSFQGLEEGEYLIDNPDGTLELRNDTKWHNIEEARDELLKRAQAAFDRRAARDAKAKLINK
jgi:hypothetical protein